MHLYGECQLLTKSNHTCVVSQEQKQDLLHSDGGLSSQGIVEWYHAAGNKLKDITSATDWKSGRVSIVKHTNSTRAHMELQQLAEVVTIESKTMSSGVWTLAVAPSACYCHTHA